jgi:hypothetical protein
VADLVRVRDLGKHGTRQQAVENKAAHHFTSRQGGSRLRQAAGQDAVDGAPGGQARSGGAARQVWPSAHLGPGARACQGKAANGTAAKTPRSAREQRSGRAIERKRLSSSRLVGGRAGVPGAAELGPRAGHWRSHGSGARGRSAALQGIKSSAVGKRACGGGVWRRGGKNEEALGFSKPRSR